MDLTGWSLDDILRKEGGECVFSEQRDFAGKLGELTGTMGTSATENQDDEDLAHEDGKNMKEHEMRLIIGQTSQ